MKNLLTIREYEHKGIKVLVEIDFVRGTASLVEPNASKTAYLAKKWLFAKREVSYLKSWLNVFDAMSHATTEAVKELEAYQKAEDEAKTEQMVRLSMAVNP